MNESVDQNAENYDTYCLENGLTPIYKFGDQMIDEEKLELKSDKLYVPGYDVPIELKFESTYKDMFNDK